MLRCPYASSLEESPVTVYPSSSTYLLDQAKLAWRNANRCIGRAHWKSLDLLDYRDIEAPDDLFEALTHHIEYATNGGAIRSLISVFAASTRNQGSSIQPTQILNHQLIRYAGFKASDGQITGDPASVSFTHFLLNNGWKPKEISPFVVLPLAILRNETELFIYEWPSSSILEVPIEHPDLDWVGELKLKWYAVPIIADMLFKTENEGYSMAPFNGYYMGTEIGARNLADESRYNLLPLFAEKMGLNKRKKHQLWKDRAMIELNTAVLYSFQEAGVRITDHHTESKNHVAWEQKMASEKCPVTGDWSWLVPPISGSSSPLFHRNYQNVEKIPGFFPQASFAQNVEKYQKLNIRKRKIHTQNQTTVYLSLA